MNDHPRSALDRIDVPKLMRAVESFVVKFDDRDDSPTERVAKNSFIVEMEIPQLTSAGVARAAGCQIPDSIPDVAVYKDGHFEWVSLDMTIIGDKVSFGE